MREKQIYALTLIIATTCILTIAGCGKDEPKTEPAELVVLCGSSFVKPTEQLCAEFTKKTGIAVVTTVAGSEDFLPLIKVGKQGDILVTHDPYLDYVADANALADHIQVGFVAPVIAVQKGNPKGIKKFDDLTRPGLKVAISNPEYSTCGEMVFKLFEKKGMRDAVMKNVGNRLTKGHSNLGNLLKTKTVDMVIMWNGVAHTFGHSVDVVPTPYEYDKEIQVHIIGLNYTRQPEALKKFFEFVRNRGPDVFTEYGYVK